MGFPKAPIKVFQHFGRRRIRTSLAVRGHRYWWYVNKSQSNSWIWAYSVCATGHWRAGGKWTSGLNADERKIENAINIFIEFRQRISSHHDNKHQENNLLNSCRQFVTTIAFHVLFRFYVRLPPCYFIVLSSYRHNFTFTEHLAVPIPRRPTQKTSIMWLRKKIELK